MEREPKLLEAFLRFGDVSELDDATHGTLRLCSHQIKKVIDATVFSCKIKPEDINLICGCDWKLKELSIHGSWSIHGPLRVLPNALFKKFSLLETLKIQGCTQLEALPENIGELIHLTDIQINGGYRLATLPLPLGQLTALELSDCWNLTLEDLAPLKQLQQLKILKMGGVGDYSSDPLSTEWICNNITTGLRELCLRRIEGSLPSTISNFKQLTQLCLPEFYTPELPDSIGLLSSLAVFVGPDDGLDKLPESFSLLTSLKELDLTVNLEGIAPLKRLTGLTNLLLQFYTESYLQYYLDVIWNLTLLKSLHLTDKTSRLSEEVYSLSDNISKLKNLESLHIGDLRNLHKLPESIGTLSCLTKLELTCTGVKSLPDAIGKLDALKVLTLFDCRNLTSIADSFADLVLGTEYANWSLEEVDLRGCYNLVLSRKMKQAMKLLRSHGVLVEH
jgi:hypothetical protein